MKEQKHYCSLIFKGGNTFHEQGKRIKLTEKIINIGETADCDVRFEAGEFQPEYYATIIQNEDGKSWRIVKHSQHVDVSIAGKGTIGYAHQLADGDIIQFENQPMSLCFHKHYDDRYNEEEKSNIWQWLGVGLLAFMAIIAVILSFNRQEGICEKDVESLEASIYLVKVDSVCRVLKDHGTERLIPPTKILVGEAPTGTAFLTTDGIMVTARHCVEYWVGENLDLTTKVADMPKDHIVRWAIEAESFNQSHTQDSAMQLKVFFSLYDFMDNQKYAFSSTDSQVHINRERDGVFMLADFSQDYYWRSIRPYFTDRQMELGDILWIDGISEQGNIRLADKEKLKEIKNGTKLMICGYPITGIGDKRMTSTAGTIRRSASAETENLFFESNINHGFSGGPVLMKFGADVVAVGVVSRVDSISSGLYKWAVPVSEVKCEKKECAE